MFTKVDFESVCNGKAWGGLIFQDRFHPVLRYEVKLAGLASGFRSHWCLKPVFVGRQYGG